MKDLDLVALIKIVNNDLPSGSKDYDQAISLGVRAWAAAKLGRIQLGGVQISGGLVNAGEIIGGDKIVN